jgi:hypothetical protein
MTRYLVLLLAFVPTLAHAQSTRVTHAVDCVTGRLRCNETQHPAVTAGLKAPEGSAARFQAEMCKMFPLAADQEQCMAGVREEPKAPEVAAAPVPAPKVVAPPLSVAAPPADTTTCDFIGPISTGRIHAAFERCDLVTVLTSGVAVPYRRPAPPAADPARAPAPVPTVEGTKTQVSTLLKVSEPEFGTVSTKVVRGTQAVCGQVTARNGSGGDAAAMKFVAANGKVYLIEGTGGNAVARVVYYEYCDD